MLTVLKSRKLDKEQKGTSTVESILKSDKTRSIELALEKIRQGIFEF